MSVRHVPPEPIKAGDAPGQGSLLSFQLIESMEQPSFAAFVQTHLGPVNGDPRFGTIPAPTDGVDVYCYMYGSIDYYGNATTLSGAVAFPLTGAPKGTVIYMHGTAVGQHNCPSSGIEGTDAYNEAIIAIATLASGGYAVVMPDYIGQGASLAAHPYVSGAKNAPSGRDAAIAAFQIADQLHRSVGPNLFITGYSEGGANAMALCRLMEFAPIDGHTYVRGAPCSGPYDLSGAQREMLMAPITPDTSDLQFAPLLLTGDLANSANAYSAIPPNTIFKRLLANQIVSSFSGTKTGKQVAEDLIAYATLEGYRKRSDGNYHLADVMTPAAVAGLTGPDPSFPLFQVLRANDLYEWTPSVPIYLTALFTDTLVSYGNTVSAVTYMRGQGVTTERMNYHGIAGKDLNHLTNFPGSMILVRRFFDGGYDAVPVDPD